jgi:nicotinamide-nucleotide amidase
MPSAELVAIGSELLLGQIVDTNSAWMAQRLTALGVNLFHTSVVGDNAGRMADVIDRALDRADIVICGGGLGPTQDDISREVIAEVTGRELVLDPELLETIERMFRSRGFLMTKNNERQAFIPDGSLPIHNPNGTAPSFAVEDKRGVVFALPGVPFELKWLFDNEVVPYIRKRYGLSEVITYRVLKVAQLGESNVDDRIGHLIANSSNPTVGVLAHPGQVDVRIAAKAPSIEEAKKLIDPVEQEVRELLGDHVFAIDDDKMEDVVGRLLAERDLTIASYEDVTHGMVAERMQEATPERFIEAVVANGLGPIKRLLAAADGGVPSDPVALADALAMAVRTQAGADLGVAVHGVPDPDDHAENLAKGQTYISVTDGANVRRRTFNLSGRGRPDRTRISLDALALVRAALIEGF